MRKVFCLKVLIVASALLMTTVSQGFSAEKQNEQKLTLKVHQGPNGGWISLDWDYFYSKLQTGKAMINVNKQVSIKGTIKKSKPDSFGGHVTSDGADWQQKHAPKLFKGIICGKRAVRLPRLIRKRVVKPTIKLSVMDQGKNKVVYSTKRYRIVRNAAFKHYRKTLCKRRSITGGPRPAFDRSRGVEQRPKFNGRNVGKKATSKRNTKRAPKRTRP